jgi:two-component system chemotaxis response regulator CheB
MNRPLVRVLVLDPSAQRRQRLQQLLEADGSLQVVGAVGNADHAIEVAVRRLAEVILVGQGAPSETVHTTRHIMQARATPIVVVTTASSPVEDRQAFPLMEAGALAVVHDPGAAHGPQHAAALAKLVSTVRLMAEVKVVRRWASLAATAAPQPLLASGRIPQLARPARDGIELVAIGASTGGPVALKQLLLPLPASFPVPLVVVQHMSDGFLRGMADWLGAACALPVQIATPGTELLPGRVYLAPDGKHMRIAANRQLSLDAGAPVYGHRPAVSCLFASVAEQYGRHAIGILLTGMGKDGAAELKLMKEAGAITIAQDEASSAVHGMPGEAIRGGAASYVMSPEEIGAALPALVQR